MQWTVGQADISLLTSYNDSNSPCKTSQEFSHTMDGSEAEMETGGLIEYGLIYLHQDGRPIQSSTRLGNLAPLAKILDQNVKFLEMLTLKIALKSCVLHPYYTPCSQINKFDLTYSIFWCLLLQTLHKNFLLQQDGLQGNMIPLTRLSPLKSSTNDTTEKNFITIRIKSQAFILSIMY